MRFEIFDLNTWKIVDTLETNEGPFGYFSNISNDESLFISWISGGLRVWDMHSKKAIAFLPISIADNNFKQLWVYQSYFSEDNSKVFTLIKKKFNPGDDPHYDSYTSYLMEFDLQKHDSIATYPAGVNIAFSKNVQFYATNYLTADNGVQIYDINSKKVLWTLPTNGASVTGMQFSPDNKYLFITHPTGLIDQGMDVWNITDKKLIYRFNSIQSSGYDCLSISDDGKYVAAPMSVYLYLYRTDGFSGISDPQNPADIIYPNPTNGTINLEFVLPNPGITNITVTNETGKILNQFFNGFLSQGSQKLTYEVKGLPPGSYFVQIQNKTYSKIFKLIINK